MERTTERWHDVGAQGDFAAGAGKCAQVGNDSVAVFNAGGELFAVLNACPHAGMPLAGAQCRGTTITCSFHNFAYDLRTGRNIDYPHDEPPLRKLRVKVENGRVLIAERAKPTSGSATASDEGNLRGQQ